MSNNWTLCPPSGLKRNSCPPLIPKLCCNIWEDVEPCVCVFDLIILRALNPFGSTDVWALLVKKNAGLPCGNGYARVYESFYGLFIAMITDRCFMLSLAELMSTSVNLVMRWRKDKLRWIASGKTSKTGNGKVLGWTHARIACSKGSVSKWSAIGPAERDENKLTNKGEGAWDGRRELRPVPARLSSLTHLVGALPLSKSLEQANTRRTWNFFFPSLRVTVLIKSHLSIKCSFYFLVKLQTL